MIKYLSQILKFDFFKLMVDDELFDLPTRENKEMGGYCTGIYDYKVPFIFSNANGTAKDVDTLTHEAGHAFQAYSSFKYVDPRRYEELKKLTAERLKKADKKLKSAQEAVEQALKKEHIKYKCDGRVKSIYSLHKKLAKYNERDKNAALDEGEIIWLKKKQTKAPKDYKGRLHYVRNGESMYSIAQKYGIRLKNLYKMNHLSPDYQIRVGDTLRLR